MSTQGWAWRRKPARQRLRARRYSLVRNLLAGLVVAGFWLWSPLFAAAQTATFDFDSGTPTLTTYQNLPVGQTVGGITASFSAVAGNFSMQTDGTTRFTLSLFSGNYLYPNVNRGSVLRMQFGRELTDIEFTFATTEYKTTNPTPTPIVVNVFSVTPSGTTSVGSVTASAAYGTNTFPMGTAAYHLGSKTFNRVEVGIQAGGNATFMVDNVTVTTVPELNISAADTNTVVVSWPSPSTGFGLQQISALGATNWVSVTNAVEVVNGQNQVTISPAIGNGFYRLLHP